MKIKRLDTRCSDIRNNEKCREFVAGLRKGFASGMMVAIMIASSLAGAHVGLAIASSKLFGPTASNATSAAVPTAPSSKRTPVPVVRSKTKPAPASSATISETRRSKSNEPPVATTPSFHQERREPNGTNIVNRLAEQFRKEVKASLDAFKKELLAENRKLRSRVRRLERKVRTMEKKLRKISAGHAKRGRVESSDARYQHLSRNARILATIQIEGEWMAYLQVSTGDRRRVHVGSKLGDLTVKDIAPRKVVLESTKGQRVILTVSGV